MDKQEFFRYISFALSEANAKIQFYTKRNDLTAAKEWRRIHSELTHCCSKIQTLQY